MNTHVFIMIRYSVLSEETKAWRISKDLEFSEYREVLFSKERLKSRLDMFKNITLPSISRLDKNKVTVLIFTSCELPEEHLYNLKETVCDFSNVKVFPLESQGALGPKMDSVLKDELGLIGSEVCYATVRLDDDDALSNRFYNNLKRYLDASFAGYAVSFGRGFIGLMEGGKFEKFYERVEAKIGLGLSFINVFKSGEAVLKPFHVYGLGSHMKIDLKVPVVVDSTTPMFIRTAHGMNDIPESVIKRHISGSKEVRFDKVRKYFDIDLK